MPGTWKTISPLPTVASGTFSSDTMLLLTDGSVLLHNAYGKEWLRLTPDSSGRYETGAWSTEFDMINTREYFASGVLSDGRVFAIGGEDSDAGSDTPLGEIFDPQTNQWSAIAKPSSFDFVRGDCNGSVLSDGRVLLGGATPSGPPPTWSKRTAIWDPRTNDWIEAGLKFGTLAKTDKEDPFEEETFALLRDGSVLAPAVRDTPKAQRYVPWLDEWVDCAPSPVKLSIDKLKGVGVYETGPVILLPDGKAFVIGGTGKTAIFTSRSARHRSGFVDQRPGFSQRHEREPELAHADRAGRAGVPAAQRQGRVLAGTTEPDAGDYFSLNPVFLEYDPHSSATTLPPLDVQPSLPTGNWTWQSCFLLLPTGQMLCSAQSNTLYLYTPDPGQRVAASFLETGAHLSSRLHGSRAQLSLSGMEINGLSQAVCYGDDAGMATNYPIVRLTNRAPDESRLSAQPRLLDHGRGDRNQGARRPPLLHDRYPVDFAPGRLDPCRDRQWHRLGAARGQDC